MLYLDSRESEKGKGERAMVCGRNQEEERSRTEREPFAGGGAIAVPRSSSSVMGCMIYVVDVPVVVVVVVRPFSTVAASFHVRLQRGGHEARSELATGSDSMNEESRRGLRLGRRKTEVKGALLLAARRFANRRETSRPVIVAYVIDTIVRLRTTTRSRATLPPFRDLCTPADDPCNSNDSTPLSPFFLRLETILRAYDYFAYSIGQILLPSIISERGTMIETRYRVNG